MPGSGRLAVGAIAAAILAGAAGGAEPPVALAILLGASALAGAGWLVAAAFAHPVAGRRIAVLAAGALAISIRLLIAPPAMPPIDVALPAGAGPWPAVIVTVGPLREGARPAVVELEEPTGLLVAATLPAWPAVVPGDLVAIDGELEPRPDGEYGDYLRRIGAAGSLRARSVTLRPAPADTGRVLESLRRGADAALGRAIPEPEGGLASGILIGLRDRVDRDLAAAFTAVGASHVVAISGWNIAIVAATLGALAGRVARRRRAALTAAAIVTYVVFVGASPSVVRAAAMAGVVLMARELGRPSTAAAAIGWAVTLLLVLDPRLIDDVGFRLSALATAGLIAWGTPLSARLAGPSPGRFRAWLAESLGVSLAAQLATLPIVALEFGRLSIVSPVVNLGVVPLVAPAMAAGVVALLGGALTAAGAPALLATLGGLPAWAILSAIVALVRAGAAVPFASVALDVPWDAIVAASAGAVILGVDRWLRAHGGRGSGRTTRAGRSDPFVSSAQPTTRRVRGPRGRAERLVAGSLAAAVVALAVAIVHRPDGIARLIVLDVGQGDAILLEGQRGGRLLVDGGPDPGRLLVALDEELPPWDRRIDVVVLSHPHEDHAAGLAALLGRYAVQRVLEPGMLGPGPGYQALNAVLAAGGIERGILATGDRLAVDDIRLSVLWPDAGTVPERPPDDGTGINNVSIVLLGEAGRHRFLLTGDIEEGIDPTLLARGLPAVEILKVAHHGSRTASTGPFLAAVQPAIAIVSAGSGNPYGHPAAATLERIKTAGARILRTDLDGTVEVELGPGPLRVRAEAGVAIASDAETGAGATAGRVAVGAAFLCGLAPTIADTVLTGPGPGDARATPPPSIANVAAVRRPLADAATWTLRYHAGRDLPDVGSPGSLPDRRPGRLLLGRRRIRDRCRRGGRPKRSGPLPGGRAGTLAHPGGGRRGRSNPRRAPRAARDRDDVRVGYPRDPVERRTARPAGRGQESARRGDRPACRGQRAGHRRGDRVGQEGPTFEGAL